MLTSKRQNPSCERTDEKSGFTLIELSIVLVIIGLIIGGILTGQDLIKAAEQRATLAQIEKYNTAVNTFRNKFGGIPGDLLYTTANSFSLGPSGVSTLTSACGDGNGLLQDGQQAGSGTNGNTPVGEILNFWSELSVAGLIDGSYGQTDMTNACVSSAGATALDFPLAKLARGNYIIVGTDDVNGYNTFALAGIPSTFTGTTSANYAATMPANDLNPLESYNMDKKVDDGMPNTGSVQARNAAVITRASAFSPNENLTTSNAATGAAASTPGDCQMGSATLTVTSNTYNVVNSSGNASASSPACSLRFRFN